MARRKLSMRKNWRGGQRASVQRDSVASQPGSAVEHEEAGRDGVREGPTDSIMILPLPPPPLPPCPVTPPEVNPLPSSIQSPREG
eukprot:3937148-Rhodomonas_salina.1